MEHVAEKDKDASFDTCSLHEDGSKSSKMKTKFTSDKVDDSILEQVQKQISKEKTHQWKSWKSSERSCSSEGEDAEPELEAIPESPKSESSEMEQFPTDLSCYPQTVEQACAKLVKEPYSVRESVVVSDPWSKVTEATLVSNSENLNMNNSELKDQNTVDLPHSSVSSDAENANIIEKSSYEIMEKNIEPKPEATSKVHSEKKIAECIDQPDSPSVKKLTLQCSFSETDPLLKNYSQSNTVAPDRPTSSKIDIQLQSEKKDIEFSEQYKFPTLSLKKSDSKDISRMKSLPFEGNKHQSVCRSKTDSNILSLPQSDESKMSHSRYPHSKMFQGKKNLSSKASRKAEMLSSDNLTIPIFRPPLERLLPIGMPDRERPRRSDTMSSMPLNEPEAYHPPLRIDHSLSRDTFTSKDLCEDKGVQTGNVDIMFDIPAPERLLPVGPLPTKKDSFPVYSKSEYELKKQDSVKTIPEHKSIPSPSLKSTPSPKLLSAQKAIEHKSIEKDDIQGAEAKDLSISKSEPTPPPKSAEKVETGDKKCLEQIDSFPFSSMGIECIANTIFDFTSDIAQPLPGIFEVCKTAMDIKKEDNFDQDKKAKDAEPSERNHRNSASSVDGLQNEKIELTTFSDNIQKGLEKGEYHFYS